MACAELGLDYVWHEMDIVAGETRTPRFLALNPNGKVPLMTLADGRVLPGSNAIVSYLADGTALAGTDRCANECSIADIALLRRDEVLISRA